MIKIFSSQVFCQKTFSMNLVTYDVFYNIHSRENVILKWLLWSIMTIFMVKISVHYKKWFVGNTVWGLEMGRNVCEMLKKLEGISFDGADYTFKSKKLLVEL